MPLYPFCCVLNCSNGPLVRPKNDPDSLANTSRYKCPADVSVREQWVKAIGRGNCIMKKKSSYICSEHFVEADFDDLGPDQLRQLKETAVPSIFNEFKSRKGKIILTSKQTKDDLQANTQIIKVTNKTAVLSLNKCNRKSPRKNFDVIISENAVTQDNGHDYCIRYTPHNPRKRKKPSNKDCDLTSTPKIKDNPAVTTGKLSGKRKNVEPDHRYFNKKRAQTAINIATSRVVANVNPKSTPIAVNNAKFPVVANVNKKSTPTTINIAGSRVVANVNQKSTPTAINIAGSRVVANVNQKSKPTTVNIAGSRVVANVNQKSGPTANFAGSPTVAIVIKKSALPALNISGSAIVANVIKKPGLPAVNIAGSSANVEAKSKSPQVKSPLKGASIKESASQKKLSGLMENNCNKCRKLLIEHAMKEGRFIRLKNLLKRKVNLTNKRLKRREAALKKLRNEIKIINKKMPKLFEDKMKENLSGVPLALVYNQLINNNRTTQYYCQEVKDLAINLYSASAKSYEYMKKVGFNLPTNATVKTWIIKSKSKNSIIKEKELNEFLRFKDKAIRKVCDVSKWKFSEMDISDLTEEGITADVAEEDNIADVTEEDITADVTEEDITADVTEEDNIADVTEEDITADVTEEDNIADVTEEDNIADVTEEDNIADVTEEYIIDYVAEEDIIADVTEEDIIADVTQPNSNALDLNPSKNQEDMLCELESLNFDNYIT